MAAASSDSRRSCIVAPRCALPLFVMAALSMGMVAARVTAQGLESLEMVDPIGTSEYERSVIDTVARLRWEERADAAALDERAWIARLEPLHDAYLAEALRLRDECGTPILRGRRSVHAGASVAALRAERRQIARLRTALDDTERRFFSSIETALPEECRGAVGAMRQARERARFASKLSQIQGFARLDLVDVVSGLRLGKEDVQRIAPIMDDYEARLLSVLRNWQRWSEERDAAWVDGLEPFAAELAENAGDDLAAEEARLAIVRSVMEVNPVGPHPPIDALAPLNARTVQRLLEALPPAERRALRRAVERRVGGMHRSDLAARCERMLAHVRAESSLTSEERDRIDAIGEAWRRDDDAAIERNLKEVASAVFDAEAGIVVSHETSQRDQAFLKERRQVLCTATESINAVLGQERATRLGFEAFTPPGSTETRYEWRDPELLRDESPFAAVHQELGAFEPSGAFQRGAGPLDLETLRQWCASVALDDAGWAVIEATHRSYLDQWSRRVDPITAALRQVLPANPFEPIPPSAEIDAALAASAELFEARRALLEAAMAADDSLFDAIDSAVGTPERRAVLTTARLARRWSLLVDPTNQFAIGGLGFVERDVNIGKLALSRKLSDDARAAVGRALEKRRAEFERALVEHAQIDIEETSLERRVVLFRAMASESEEARREYVQAVDAVRAAEMAYDERQWALRRVARAIAEEAAASLDDVDGHKLRELWRHLSLPGLARSKDSAEPILDRLLSFATLSDEERDAVERIDTEFRAASTAAVDGMAAIVVRREAPAKQRSWRGRHRDNELAMSELARWRFARDEADQKAKMHLRGALTPETLARLAALRLEAQ